MKCRWAESGAKETLANRRGSAKTRPIHRSRRLRSSSLRREPLTRIRPHMSNLEAALATQLKNIEIRTGKSLAQLAQIVKASSLTKHGEIRDMLKRDLKMGHGDANTLVHHVLRSAAPATTGGEGDSLDRIVDGYYSGPKTALRPIHDRLMREIKGFGEFEIAPKKTYLSLRRKKQFAMIGPATNTRVEVGLNLKGVPATERLISLPPKGMCDYKVNLTAPEQIDSTVIGWIRMAYDSAA